MINLCWHVNSVEFLYHDLFKSVYLLTSVIGFRESSSEYSSSSKCSVEGAPGGGCFTFFFFRVKNFLASDVNLVFDAETYFNIQMEIFNF